MPKASTLPFCMTVRFKRKLVYVTGKEEKNRIIEIYTELPQDLEDSPFVNK